MTKYAPTSAPTIGKGRYTLPAHALRQQSVLNTPREIRNPQTLWKNTKSQLRSKSSARTCVSLQTTLEKLVARDKKDHMKAILANHGEKLGGPWSAISKESKPRDLLVQLRIPNSTPPEFERCSKRMAKLARDYHDKLQGEGLTLPDQDPEYELKTRAILEEIPPNQRLSEETKETATGMDGCPYELWKKLNERYNQKCEKDEEGFDIAGVLAKVFRDVQEFGVDDSTDFALGWMCPIKVLAIQIMEHIPSMVHPNQAGFIPKRSIFNHVRLWQTMNEFNLPHPFTDTVKALYRNAYTRVAINGELSTPFQVTRGVRQGDPLSCALFDHTRP